MNSIWAGIVTYNPDIDRLKENISAIIKQVNGLAIVDNNSINVEEIVELISEIDMIYTDKDIVLVKNSDNLGVASALNIVMSTCSKNGHADYVVTLDQDTVVYDNLIDMYKSLYNSAVFDKKIVSMTCLRHDRNYIEKSNNADTTDKKSFNYVRSCITSGNLVSVAAWHEVGGFDERLFIDMVDDEFCYRLREHGYSIARVNQYGFIHELGSNIKKVKFLGKEKTIVGTSMNRKYYVARNVMYMTRRYKLGIFNDYKKYLYKKMIGSLLYENDRISSMKQYFKGIKDSKKMDIIH